MNEPKSVWIWFAMAEEGGRWVPRIRKWQSEPFPEGQEYALTADAPAPQETAPEVGPVGQLLPCPFCGGKVTRRTVDKDEYGRLSYGVQCANGDCWIVGPQFESRQEADDGWNRRASPPPSAAPTDNTALAGVWENAYSAGWDDHSRERIERPNPYQAALASRPAAPVAGTDVVARLAKAEADAAFHAGEVKQLTIAITALTDPANNRSAGEEGA